jgi:hypothetical protein
MSALVVVPCTDRKRQAPDDDLMARNLPCGTLTDVADAWVERLHDAGPEFCFKNLYCGRAFREAVNAADGISANLYVLSAGLGVVSADECGPSYSLTVSPRNSDSISQRVSTSPFFPEQWWSHITTRATHPRSLKTLFLENEGPILMALSSNYATMIKGELEALTPNVRSRLRLFGMAIDRYLPPELLQNVMPYDARLNGPDSPLPGTLSDFSSRALRHFADGISSREFKAKDPLQDAKSVTACLAGLDYPEVPRRARRSDKEIVVFINKNWSEMEGRSGRMLRLLRDSGLACEQSRFRDLFKEASKFSATPTQ